MKRNLLFRKKYQPLSMTVFSAMIKTLLHSHFLDATIDYLGPGNARGYMAGIRSLGQIAPELSEDSKERTEQHFTLDEIEHAIDGLAAHKTPCPDGLCSEFIKHLKKKYFPFSSMLSTRPMSSVGSRPLSCSSTRY